MNRNWLKVVFASALGFGITGCAAYGMFGTTPEQVHNAAVQKVGDYAELALARKIDASPDLTDAAKLKLKKEISALRYEIEQKLNEIKAKTDTAREAKAAAKAEAAEKTDATLEKAQ